MLVADSSTTESSGSLAVCGDGSLLLKKAGVLAQSTYFVAISAFLGRFFEQSGNDHNIVAVLSGWRGYRKVSK